MLKNKLCKISFYKIFSSFMEYMDLFIHPVYKVEGKDQDLSYNILTILHDTTIEPSLHVITKLL